MIRKYANDAAAERNPVEQDRLEFLLRAGLHMVETGFAERVFALQARAAMTEEEATSGRGELHNI